MEDLSLVACHRTGESLGFPSIYFVSGLPPGDFCIIARVDESLPLIRWRVCWYQPSGSRIHTPSALYDSPQSAMADMQDMGCERDLSNLSNALRQTWQ
jgi:hypothetical protein